MSIFQLPLLLVFVSFLLCPVASQTEQGVREVKSGHCTSAELVGTVADCQAAGKALGLGGTVETESVSYWPPGCIWQNYYGGLLRFNTNKASTTPCDDGTINGMCLCVDPCPIGNYQNEESSKTCKSCLAGTYNDKTGQALCKGCTGGRYSLYSTEVGQTIPITCKGSGCSAGKFSSEIGNGAPTKCIPCLAGSYNNEIGRASCKSCLLGTYNVETGKSLCTSCPEGWSATSSGSTACSTFTGQTPKKVKSGQCTSAELVGSAADCQAAAKALGLRVGTVGTGSWGNDGPPGCIWDGLDALNFNPNKASTTACSRLLSVDANAACLCIVPCPFGTYQNETSITTCKSCLPGTYNDETGQKSCKYCPFGWTTSKAEFNTCPVLSSAGKVVIFSSVVVVLIIAFILVWYHFKVVDEETEEYETFTKFYCIVCKRCSDTICCIDRSIYNRLDNLQMTVPLVQERDPSVGDPLELPQWKIPSDQLIIGKRLGQGGCGWVYQGTLGGAGASVPIACKEVMSATINPKDLHEFRHEARMVSTCFFLLIKQKTSKLTTSIFISYFYSDDTTTSPICCYILWHM
jgi:hypothetical protein